MKLQKLILVILFVCFFANFANAKAPQIIDERGGRVKAIQYDDETWQLFVENKPFFIKGILYNPVKIGESPHEQTMRDWTYYDDNQDGMNDFAYQTWLDENKNNTKDKNEHAKGDFFYLKNMGVNAIRVYHVASNNPLVGDIYKKSIGTQLQFDHAVNKKLLNSLYNDYGIMVMMGHFVGAWAVGSDASWEKGTDYTNPEHIQKIKDSVKAMVLDNKDEPYVLMWVLGNENNLAFTKTNAHDHPEAYAKMIGELAEIIHGIDPNHPVAVCDGEDNFQTLRQYAKHAKDLDIISFNSYRGVSGFGSLWKEAKKIFDRPIFISEYGIFAYNSKVGEDEDLQLTYDKGNWRDIVENSRQYHLTKGTGIGNAIGGVVFDSIDRWYMDGTPNAHNPGTGSWQSPDGLRHEEWFGILSIGDGSDPLMRQKRKIYDYFKGVWNQKSLTY